MKITGELHLRRMLAVIMTLVMLLTTFTVPALAQEDWHQLQLYVSWAGASAPVQAYAIPGSHENAFWVTVDASALNDGITVTASHPSHPGYTFTPSADEPQFPGNAGSADGKTALTITAYENEAPVDTYKLYVSTNPIPAVNVRVRYEAAGQTLYEMSYPVTPYQQTTISPDASVVPAGYQLEDGQGGVSVYVDMNGANPSEVVFYCKQAAQAVDVPVLYMDSETGATLNSISWHCEPGDTQVPFDWGMVPDGYTYDGDMAVNVHVDAIGANPSQVVFYLKKAVYTANVDVQYVDSATNAVLSSTTVQVSSTDPVVRFDPSAVPEGYTYNGQTEMYIEVTANGANPSTVQFRLDQMTYTANVDVQYVDNATNAVLSSTTVQVSSTDPVVRFDPSAVPEGYTYSGQTEMYIEVTANGANPSTVQFRLDQMTYTANVDVQYVDSATNAVFYTTTATVSSTDPVVRFDASVMPEGYTYGGATEMYVEVTANGANPSVVEFRCDPPLPTDTPEPTAEPTAVPTDVPTTEPTAEPTAVPTEVPTDVPTEAPVDTEVPAATMVMVTVRYIRSDTYELVRETSFEMENGASMRVEPAWADYPDFNIDPVYVDVTANADAMNMVEFMLTPIQQATDAPTDVPTTAPTPDPVRVEVLVIYQSEDGSQVFDQQQVVCVQEEQKAIEANSANIPAGYTLIGESVVYVTVDASGYAYPNPVVFSYAAPLPADRDVDVLYQLENGQLIAQTTEFCKVGETTVTPDASKLPANYVLIDTDPVTVTLDQNGNASPDPVVFRVMELPPETPIPQGTMIQRWGSTTAGGVNVRREPSATSSRVTQLKNKGTMVYVLREEMGQDDALWTRVLINGEQCFIKSEYITVMSGYDSDQYMAEHYNSDKATPVPPMTADMLDGGTTDATATPTTEPTHTPTTVPATDVPATDAPGTDVPTLIPVTEAPTATATPVPYFGYALTTQRVALRTSISKDDGSIIATLEKNTLVRVTQPGYDTDGTPWSVVTTLDNMNGMLPDSSLRRITDEEAKFYIDQWAETHATATPTFTPTPSPVPAQVQGYAVPIGDGVPYRLMPSSLSVILGYLMSDEVVYVQGQEYAEGVVWDVVQYGGQWVCVQADLLRMMTREEELDYLTQSQKTPEPTLAVEAPTYNPDGLSSYGYVSASSVNFRTGAGTNNSTNKKYPTLKQYAFCLVLGTQKIGNTTWYNVNYNGEKGYVSGDYFHQMTITELENFINSPEYQQGLTNNNTAQDPLAGTGTSGLPSYEEQARQEHNWQGSGTSVSYQPFEPFQTPGPLDTSSASPSASPSTSPSDEPTISFEPLPTAGLEGKTEEGGSGATGWIIALVIFLLLAAAGGVYVFLRIRDSKRKMAQRAAQRRAQAARGDARPYARNNGAAPAQQQPRTGSYPNQNAQQQPRRPYAGTPGQNGQQLTVRPNQNGNGETTVRSNAPQTNVRPGYTPNTATARPTQVPDGEQTVRPTPLTPNPTVFGTVTGYERPNDQTPKQQPTDTATYRPMPQAQQPTDTATYHPVTQPQQPTQPTDTATYRPMAQPQQDQQHQQPTSAATYQTQSTQPAQPAQPEQPSTYTATYRPGNTTPRVGRRSAYRQTHNDYTASYRTDETPSTDAGKPGDQPNTDLPNDNA